MGQVWRAKPNSSCKFTVLQVTLSLALPSFFPFSNEFYKFSSNVHRRCIRNYFPYIDDMPTDVSESSNLLLNCHHHTNVRSLAFSTSRCSAHKLDRSAGGNWLGRSVTDADVILNASILNIHVLTHIVDYTQHSAIHPLNWKRVRAGNRNTIFHSRLRNAWTSRLRD